MSMDNNQLTNAVMSLLQANKGLIERIEALENDNNLLQIAVNKLYADIDKHDNALEELDSKFDDCEGMFKDINDLIERLKDAFND